MTEYNEDTDNDSELVAVDCCDDLRPEDDTVLGLDSNGDVDVRVCRRGTGCDLAMAELDAAENAYWAALSR